MTAWPPTPADPTELRQVYPFTAWTGWTTAAWTEFFPSLFNYIITETHACKLVVFFLYISMLTLCPPHPVVRSYYYG